MSEEIVGQFIDDFLAGDQLSRTDYLVDGWRQQSLLVVVVDVSTVKQRVVTS